jgi:type I restriction enzyme S subunit
MAGEWVETSLAAVMDVNHGFAFPGENIREDLPGDILLTPGNFAIGGGFKGDRFKYFDGEVPTDYVLSEGDLIITMTDLSKQADTLGYPALVPKSGGTRFLHNQRLGKVLIKDKAELDRGYLYYLLCTADYRHEVLASATGTTVKHTSPSRILAYKASIPPLAEQKAIAAVLGALDDKIELNRRMNAKLEEMARALFQSWFVDFDPVRAKLDGREPVGLDSDTAAFFPEHFDHGEHDMLPVGWGLVAIEEVCAINAWTLGKYDDLETLEYVEISEVSRGNIANIANYQRGEEPSRARRRLRHGDTVLSTVRPDRGSYFLSLNPPENRVCSTGFAVLTPSKVPWSFLHVALTLPDVSDHLGQMADGGAYPAVRPEVIGAMQVSLPKNPKVLEAFHRTCAPLFEQAEANRTQSRTLATLRDTLLPKLLSGELQPTQSCPTGETLCQTT